MGLSAISTEKAWARHGHRIRRGKRRQNGLAFRITQSLLPPVSRDRAAPSWRHVARPSQNEKKMLCFFDHALHGAHSWPVSKPRPSCICWHQKRGKVAAVLCPCIEWCLFSAHHKAETELHSLAAKLEEIAVFLCPFFPHGLFPARCVAETELHPMAAESLNLYKGYIKII